MGGKLLHDILGLTLPSPSHSVSLPEWPNKVKVTVKRDDLIHPIISGNKWRKLAGVFPSISDDSQSKVISFGGGYSNHLHALAYICYKTDTPFVAIVRGDYSNNMTPMLKDISSWGCEIRFVSKVEYRKRTQPDYQKELLIRHGANLLIPEGGSSEHVHKGIGILAKELDINNNEPYTHIVLPVASGGTMAGLIDHYNKPKNEALCMAHSPHILGIAVLKGRAYLESLVVQLSAKAKARNWSINHDYHHGGYAKRSDELINFIDYFSSQTNVLLEPVYSGKCMYALNSLILKGFFKDSSHICFIHTGGMQGNRAS